jgi:hypothetical protein
MISPSDARIRESLQDDAGSPLNNSYVGATPISRSRRLTNGRSCRPAAKLSAWSCILCLMATLVHGAHAAPGEENKAPQASRSLGTQSRRANAPSRKRAIPTPPRRAPNEAPPAPSATVEAPHLRSAPLSELPPLDLSIPPPTLPRATRSKMHGCALEWEKLKLEGRTGALMWRDFAGKCLTR